MAGFTSDSVIVANPEALATQAAAVSKQLTGIRSDFADVGDVIRATASYWTGEAADQHRHAYTELIPQVEELFNRIGEQASDLHRIALIYTGAETQAEQIVEPLPADILK